jgi:hypothetical protein
MFKWFRFGVRLSELEDTCVRLEKAFKAMELEWDTVYENFRLLNMRLSKRVKQAETLEAAETPPLDTADESKGGKQTNMFTANQRRVNAEILRRRNRNGGPNGVLPG